MTESERLALLQQIQQAAQRLLADQWQRGAKSANNGVLVRPAGDGWDLARRIVRALCAPGQRPPGPDELAISERARVLWNDPLGIETANQAYEVARVEWVERVLVEWLAGAGVRHGRGHGDGSG